MKGRLITLLAVLAVLLMTVVPASAITFGVPDEGEHPNVGAMIAEFDGEYYIICSGALISPTVFLTAAHCTYDFAASGQQVYVSFDEVLDDPVMADATLIPGTPYAHPLFATGGANNTYDIGVIVLDEPASNYYPGIQPAQLPTLGLLDQLAQKGGLVEQYFTAVGYGTNRTDKTHAFQSLYFLGERWKADSEFLALNKAWLRLSQNPSSGSGGTCYGDSGGPNFLGDTNIIAGITVTGDRFCRATNTTYRVDTVYAREFLAQFVTLP